MGNRNLRGVIFGFCRLSYHFIVFYIFCVKVIDFYLSNASEFAIFIFNYYYNYLRYLFYLYYLYYLSIKF